jgi:hypothetical protein
VFLISWACWKWGQFGGMASTSALEMAGMDRYLQLQHDQVPFKVRAKRGCATHPRSIAERVRTQYHDQNASIFAFAFSSDLDT